MAIPDRIKKFLITGFVAFIAVFQFYISVLPLTGKPMLGYYWPFIDYPMYKGAIMEGERIPVRTIVMARDSSGHETEITADIVGLGIYRFENMVRLLRTSNDEHPDVIYLLTRHLKNGTPFVELDILNYPLVITKSGAKEVPSDLLKRIRL